MSVRSFFIGGVATVGTIVGGAAIAGTGALDDNTQRDSNGEIVEAGGLGALVIEVGDCINFPPNPVVGPDGTEFIESVEGVPCDEPHDAQAYAKFDLTGILVFDTDTVSAEAQNGCLARWEGAIGTEYLDDLDHDISYLAPTKEAWAGGDHVVICLIIPFGPDFLFESLVDDDRANGS